MGDRYKMGQIVDDLLLKGILYPLAMNYDQGHSLNLDQVSFQTPKSDFSNVFKTK